MKKLATLVCITMFAGGCTVGPNYKKPVASVPPTYHGLTPEESPSTASGSEGDQKWWDLYQDEQLRTLIRTAIRQNYDARVAGTRILAARAQLVITRANQYPQVAGGAGVV